MSDKWKEWNSKGNSQKGSNWSGGQKDYERAGKASSGWFSDEEDEDKKDKEEGLLSKLKKAFSSED